MKFSFYYSLHGSAMNF